MLRQKSVRKRGSPLNPEKEDSSGKDSGRISSGIEEGKNLCNQAIQKVRHYSPITYGQRNEERHTTGVG